MPRGTPNKPRKATKDQKEFVRLYAISDITHEKRRIIDAYSKAYNNNNKDTCYVHGSKLLTLPWVEEELAKYRTTLEKKASELGMADRQLLEEHKKLIFATKKIYDKGTFIEEVSDFTAKAKGLDMMYKLLGKYAAERKQFEGPGGKPLFETDFSSMSEDELLKKQEEIMEYLNE